MLDGDREYYQPTSSRNTPIHRQRANGQRCVHRLQSYMDDGHRSGIFKFDTVRLARGTIRSERARMSIEYLKNNYLTY
jgi:hypothetical protein